MAARAILGEWLGGSGGGWQDSGGVWPGIKLIEGVPRPEGDPEYGVSRGRLLPQPPHPRPRRRVRRDARERLQDSLVLVHGGMAQNVGPDPRDGDREVSAALRGRVGRARRRRSASSTRSCERCATGDVRALGAATTRNFVGPIQTIIPWASNLYTETLIAAGRARDSATTSGASGCSAACPAAAWASSFAPAAQGRGAGRACRRS